jgi:hypothetical protein
MTYACESNVQRGTNERNVRYVYVERVFHAMEKRNMREGRSFNVNELALILLDKNRESSVFSLGEIMESQEFPDGVRLKTLFYTSSEGKIIKIYSPPNIMAYEGLEEWLRLKPCDMH